MKKKKILFIVALCVFIVGFLFFVTVLSVIMAAIGNEATTANAESIDSPIPCVITGTKTGSDLDLVLSYDGMKIKGITGTAQGNGTFSASKKTAGGQTKMALPTASGADLGVQTFMSYQAVTMTGSDQYKLLNGSGAKDVGIYRKVNGRYAIALGSFYGTKIGTTYTIEFKQSDGSKKKIQAVLGDCKADKDTDAKHQYHTVDGSVVEFVTAAGTSGNVSATQQQINRDFGVVTAIYRGGGSEVKLKGTIEKEAVTVEGTLDGTPLTASGTIKDGKIHAEGYIGESTDGAAGGGIYNGGKFAWPVPGHTRLSSDYGWRTCPYHGKEKHSGLDIPAPYGTGVRAAADGTVVTSSYLGSYGNAVIIDHGSAIFTLYGHNSSLVARVGQKVTKGQVIALVGSTGNSTGNHCHFEVREGSNTYGRDVSPWKYLKK